MKTVPKPWGKEVWFAVAPRYAGKFLHIRKGHRLSLQYHKVKHETLHVLKGTCLFTLGNGSGRPKSLKAGPGRTVVIAPRTLHRMEARWGDVTLVEVSTPELKDVVRVEDDYRRAYRPNPGSQSRRRRGGRDRRK